MKSLLQKHLSKFHLAGQNLLHSLARRNQKLAHELSLTYKARRFLRGRQDQGVIPQLPAEANPDQPAAPPWVQ